MGDPRPVVVSVLLDMPIPATTGLHVRMLSNLRAVQALGCRSVALYFTTEDARADPTALASHCDVAITLGARRPYRDISWRERLTQRLGFLTHALRSTPGRSYPFSVRYDAVGGESKVVSHARRWNADAVVLPVSLLHYAPAVASTGAAVIVDAIDVLTDLTWLLMRRAASRNPLRLPGLFVNYLACRSQERLFVPMCQECWATSPGEADRLRPIAGDCKVVVSASTFDESTVSEPTPVPTAPRIGFIGTYTSAPNLDAALHMAREVLPRILEHTPDATLALAGAGLPLSTQRQLSALPGVDVLGPVPDSATFLRSCRVVALPVFLRGGVPLKLVEALASARPVVASPQLVTGLPLQPGEDVVVAADAADFARSVARLLNDDVEAERLGRAARRAFDKHFSLASNIDRLRTESILATSGSPRRRQHVENRGQLDSA